MIIRNDRNDLVAVIHRYLDGEATAFQFDEEIFVIHDRTEDATVQSLVRMLWLLYDDYSDHALIASKQEWDLFQRVLLILESDGEIEITPGSQWTVRQAIAGIGLLLFSLIVLMAGTNHVLLLCLPFGVLSMLLSRWSGRVEERRLKDTWAVLPFSSVSEILTVRRSMDGFSKRKYPRNLEIRTIRGRLMGSICMFPASIMWLMFGPLVLLIQVLPEKRSESKVVMAC